MGPSRPPLAALGTIGLCSAAGLALCAFHASCAFPTWTDENIHLYVARRLAEGARLYSELHSARPPLALLPLALLLELGAPPLAAARGLVLAATFGTGALLCWAGQRLAGPWAGALACALFLLAPEVAARHTYTAIQLVALCTTLCVTAALLDLPALAGAAFGLGLSCGQHAAVLAVGAFLVVLVRSRRDAARFAAAAALVLLVVFGAAAARAGPAAVFEDLIGKHLYHLKSQAVPESGGDLRWYLIGVTLDHLGLLALAGVALLAARGRAGLSLPEGAPPPAGGALLVVALLFAAQLGVVAALRGSLILYLYPAVPLAALLAGVGLDAGLRGAAGALREARAHRGKAALAVALLAALLAISTLGVALSRDRYQQRDHEVYPLLPQARHAAMARLQKLDVAAVIADVVRRELKPGETLFGYPTIASAVATLAGCRISGELADLAPRWIAQGTVSRRDVVAALEADKIRFFLTPRSFFEQDKFFRDYLEHCFTAPRRFLRTGGDGRGLPDLDLFERRADTRCAPKQGPSPAAP